jgi:hypothetical protein
LLDELGALRQSITTLAKRFDPTVVTTAEAHVVVRECARIVASAETMKALAAARVADSDSWKRSGHRSPAEHIANLTGASPSNARRTLSTGKRLVGQPAVAAAGLAGQLSLDQAEAVSAGVAANPDATPDLLDKAKDLSVPELNQEVARIRAAAIGPDAQRAGIHAKRSLRRWTDRDGAAHAHIYGPCDDGARLWRIIDPLRRRLNQLRRSDQPRQSFESLDYDALLTLASIATGQDTPELSLADLFELGLFPQLDDIARPDRPTQSAGSTKPSEPTQADAPPAPPATAPGGSTEPAIAPDGPTEPTDPSGRTESGSPTGERGARTGWEAPPRDPGHPTGSTAPSSDPGAPTGSTPPSGDPARLPGMAPASPSKRRRIKKLAGSPARIIIRVDLDTLLRGVPLEGELCEIAGIGTIPVSVINDLIANDNTFIAAVLTKAEQVIGVYHHRRRPTAHQATALEFLYPTCAARGCVNRANLQTDHRADWAKTHYTTTDLLDRLCTHHHNLKTRDNWALVPGVGKRPFVPPTDRRHPGYRPHHDTTEAPLSSPVESTGLDGAIGITPAVEDLAAAAAHANSPPGGP